MPRERKLEKYQELVEQCKFIIWRKACYPIEVGCRGFAGRSSCRILSRLGMIGENKRKVIRSLVGWLGFYGISTFEGYLTPNPFLFIFVKTVI